MTGTCTTREYRNNLLSEACECTRAGAERSAQRSSFFVFRINSLLAVTLEVTVWVDGSNGNEGDVDIEFFLVRPLFPDYFTLLIHGV